MGKSLDFVVTEVSHNVEGLLTDIIALQELLPMNEQQQ